MDRVDFESPFLLGELPTAERRSLGERVRALALELHPAAAADMDLAAREVEAFEAEVRGTSSVPSSSAHPRFERQQPPPPPAVVNLPLRGRVVIGGGPTAIQASRIEVWISSRDVDPPAAGAFAHAVRVVPGLAPGAATVPSIAVPVAAPAFDLMVPMAPAAGGAATVFDGFLVVRATWRHPGAADDTTQTIRAPLRLTSAAASPFRVVLMHTDRASRYLWVAPRIVRAAGKTSAGTGTLTVRMRAGSRDATSYRAAFECNANGVATTPGFGETVFAVPILTALLVRVAAGNPGTAIQLVRDLSNPVTGPHLQQNIVGPGVLYWPRADFFRGTAAQRTHASVALELRPTDISTNSFAGRTLLLDPGHGVRYEYRERRVYEWYVAHRALTAVAEAWRALGGIATFVPTARFDISGMRIGIDLVGVGVPDEPGDRDVNLRIDRTVTPNTFTLRIVNARFTIGALAAGLGYLDGATGAQATLPFKSRAQFIADHAAFITILENRATMPAGYAVVAGSTRWSAPNYQVRARRAGAPDRWVTLTGAAGDSFALSADEVTFLARATALRAYQTEMDPRLRPILGDATDNALPSRALVDYVTNVLTSREGRSLGPNHRVRFMRANAANAYVTLHLNANTAGQDTANGVSALLRRPMAHDHPRARTGKRFLKYVDPLDKGKHGSGLKFDGSALVTSPPTQDTSVYLEVDYMDTADAAAPGGFRYGFMLSDDRFVLPTAEQILSTVVEMVLNPQTDAQLDAARIGDPE